MANDLPHSDPASVRIIRSAADWARRHAAASAGLLGAAILAAWILGGIYSVRVEESAALLRFGRLIDGAIGPGLHLRLPWGVDSVTKARTGEVHRLEISGDLTKELQFLTGDENLIESVTVVQYKITRLSDYLYKTEAPAKIAGQCVRAALVNAMAGMLVDDVLTTGKARIQNEVRKSAQEALNAYGAGITLLAINLQSTNPPSEAADAFLKVSDSKAEAARAISAAQSGRERAVNLASGEAGKITQQASAAADSRAGQAEGAAARYNAVLAQKTETPALTMTDIFMDTISKVLSRARIIVLSPGQKPRIDVNLVDKENLEAPKSAAAQATEPTAPAAGWIQK